MNMPQIIAVQVGRRDLHAGIEQVEQVVRDNAFHHVLIAKPQSNPKAIELRPAEEDLSLGFEMARGIRARSRRI